MARRAFYSFHYDADNWRAGQVRNMGVVDGNRPATDNDWEEVKKGGDDAIKEWIDDQMSGRSVAIVLIGSRTANRKWINYEIEQAWRLGKGVVGVYIHGLEDSEGNQSIQGTNPFIYTYTDGNVQLSSLVKDHDTPYQSSNYVYGHIKEKLEDWIEEAITIRDGHP